MAIITLPTITKPGSGTGYMKTKWRYIKLIGITESEFTKQQQVTVWPGDALEADVQLPPMERAEAADWLAFLMENDGGSNEFYLGPDGAEKNPRGTATGTPLVDGASQTGTTILLKGWTGQLLRGDFIQVLHPSSVKRLYMVVADTTGPASIAIRPQLRITSPADSAACSFVNPVGLFRLVGNVREWDIDQAQIYGLSFKVMESI